MLILNVEDKNTFYAPAEDECWMILAKEIMSTYALSYAHLFPTAARTQSEYDQLDKQKFVAQRKSILRRLKNGPLRSVINMASAYSALERLRIEQKRSWGIYFRENNPIDITDL